VTESRATLADRLASGPLDWGDAARLALDVVDALAERAGAWAGPDRIDPAAVLLDRPAGGGPPVFAALGATETSPDPEPSPVPRGVRAVVRLLLAMLGAGESALGAAEDGAGPPAAALRPLLVRALRSGDARALGTWGGLREALWNALHLADPAAAPDGTVLPAALVRRVQFDARGRHGRRDAVWCVVRGPGGGAAQAVLTVDPDDAGTAHHARTFRCLWPGAALAAYGLPAPAEGSTPERPVFPLRPETLLVLEPRRLFEVTAVAAAHEANCPANFLAGLLEGTGAISPALLGGRMADAALRVLLEHPEQPDTAVIGEALRATRADAAWIRAEAGRAQAEAILRRAVPQLRAWLDRRAAGPDTLNEVSRLSPRFGLSGRSDLVFPRPDGPPVVGELKSGPARHRDAPRSAPGAAAAALRPSHATQARLYALLWTDAWRRAHPDPAGGAARLVSAELFYTGSGTAFRLGPEARELSLVLATRNAMLDVLRRAVDGEPLPPVPRFAACDRCWRRAACPCPPDGRPALWGGGPDPASASPVRAYLGHFTRLLLRAVWHAQGERRRSLEPLALPSRRAQLAVETDLVLGFDAADPRAAMLAGELHGALHAEDGARVRAHRGDPGALEAFEADLTRAGRDGCELRLDGPRPPWVPPGPGWVVEPAGGFENEREGFEGLLRLRHRGDDPLVAALLGAASPGREPRPRIELPAPPFPRGWHPSQAAALERALNGGPLELVQGPPGTGKTAFVGALVAALVAAGRRVLVGALTHNAADLAARRVVEAGATDVLRIGARGNATALREALVAAGVDPERAFLETVARRARDAGAVRARLLEARVVVANCHRLGRLPWRHEFRAGGDPPFDVAVLDEATQIPEPLALAALALARRAVLVGDPRQLSCVEPSAQEWAPEPASDPTLAAAGLGPLDRSLFERLCVVRSSAMLREQHRMHERIMALPNRAFYGGTLEAAPDVRARLLEIALPPEANRPAWLEAAARPDEPLVLVDVTGGADGRRNEREAERVAETAATLRRAGLAAEQVGVVTPYRAQVALIRRRLASDPALAPILVDTVERFQGDERDAILVSLVGARPTGHLAHPNRLNVTLTRARRKLVVFGDVAGLSADPVLAELARQPETTVVRAP